MRDQTKFGGMMRYTSLNVILTYFAVFVFQPAFVLVGLAALTPARAMAAQSEVIYNDLKSKYQLDTPDDDVAKEDILTDIKQRYGKGSGGGAEVIQQLQKYQSADKSGGAVDLSRYSKGNFSSSYQSTYSEAAGGGVGVKSLQMPGVSGNNVSVNYAPEGGTKLTTDASGNISSSSVGGVVTNSVSKVVGAEVGNTGTAFPAKTTYKPHNEDDLIKVVKNKIGVAESSGKTSDSVAYRTIMDSYKNNRPQDINRNDPVFNATKDAVDDARYQEGYFAGSCQSLTTTTTKSTHYPDWRESRCSSPKKDNYQTCELDRDLNVPVYIEGGVGTMTICGPDCVKIRIGESGDNYWNGRQCGIFTNSLNLKFAKNAQLQSAVITAAEWDDHMEVKLGSEVIMYHVNGGYREPATYPFPVAGVGCETNTSWYTGDGNGTKKVGEYINVTSKVQTILNNDADKTLMLSNRVAVGDGGEGHFEITLRFSNMQFKDTQTQIPAGCYDAVLASDGTCHMDRWVGTEVGTRRLPSAILDYGKPLYPGDTGYLTWHANAEGYYCDPLAKNKLCIGEKGDQCYDYNDIKNMPDGCAEKKANPMCIEKSRTCLPGWYDAGTGQCYMEEVVYDCDEGKTVSEVVANTTNTCGELPCIGTDCSAGTAEKNKDFGQAAGLLQAMSFISADGTCTAANPEECKVFPGEQKYCGWAVGVVGSLADTDCCVAPEAGPSTMSAAMAAFSIISQMNWGDIAQGASNITGSSSFTNIYNGISSVGTTIGNTAASALQAVGNAMTTASNTVMSTLGQEIAVETAKAAGGEVAKELTMDGLIQAAKQKVMGAIYNSLGEDLVGSLIQEEVTAEGTKYVATELAGNIIMACNVLMIAYTVYKVTMMIAQMLAACKPEEMETASKIHEKACFKVGGVYCLKEVSVGIKKMCVKRAQNYCCYSSMLPRIVMQQAVVQLGLSDCSGITVAQLQKLDWSKVDLTEWVAEATLGGALPDGQDDLTLEALTGTGHVLAGTEDRDNTLERLNNRYGDDKLVQASQDTQDNIQLDTVDCSYLPRPAICKFK